MNICIKGLVDEDFVNYKKPSMFIAFPTCTFKCEKECGVCCCQNSDLATAKDIEVEVEALVDRYAANDMTRAIVVGGLEPFDSFDAMLELITSIRRKTPDDIVIYTGYTPKEVAKYFDAIRGFENIIIKFGRFVPNAPHHLDETLGVQLASPNQFAVRLEQIKEDEYGKKEEDT